MISLTLQAEIAKSQRIFRWVHDVYAGNSAGWTWRNRAWSMACARSKNGPAAVIASCAGAAPEGVGGFAAGAASTAGAAVHIRGDPAAGGAGLTAARFGGATTAGSFGGEAGGGMAMASLSLV